MKVIAILLLCAVAVYTCPDRQDERIDEIQGFGEVVGVPYYTRLGKRYYVYNVKYANIHDNNPFGMSVLNNVAQGFSGHCKTWIGDLDDTYDEDLQNCLSMTIRTNGLYGRRPVMVVIRGNDLITGTDDDYLMENLLDKDVVVVTIQYRVGPYGFLSTYTNDIPGNAGVMDVIQGLRWIQMYIDHFGADMNRVTLIGNHKVAGLIGTLTMSNLADNLFHQVIYQSGSPLFHKFATTNPLDFAKQLALEVGCVDTYDVNKLNLCLFNTRKGKLINAFRRVAMMHHGNIPFITIGGPSGILTGMETPMERYAMGKFRVVPTIGGVVRDPGHYLMSTLKYHDIHSMRNVHQYIKNYYLQHILTGDNYYYNKLWKTDRKLAHFVRNIVDHDDVYDNEDIYDLMGTGIKSGLVDTLHAIKRHGGSPYLYAFNYLGNNRYNTQFNRFYDVIGLGNDHRYLFDNRMYKNDQDKIIDLMTDLWTSFAINGKPQAQGIHIWPTMNDYSGPYLVINKNTKVGSGFENEFFPYLRCKLEGRCDNRKYSFNKDFSDLGDYWSGSLSHSGESSEENFYLNHLMKNDRMNKIRDVNRIDQFKKNKFNILNL